MAIILGIDGTDGWWVNGPWRDNSYDTNFADSFVRKIASGKGANAKYERGPLVHGGNLDISVSSGVQFILQRRKAGVYDPILLTGYSRGAAGVIQVAKQLARGSEPVMVEAMMLFDCVDRHVSFDTPLIPSNVRNVLHVLRHPAAQSREGFGNSGLNYNAGKTNYEPLKKFMCTHGGMGGCPWKPDKSKGQKGTDYIDEGMGIPRITGIVPTPMGAQPKWEGDGMTKVTFNADASVSQSVWVYCQTYLQRHGFI